MSRIRRIAPGLGRGGLIGNTEGPEAYLRELDTLPSQFCRATGGTETVISQGGKFYRVHTFTDTDPTSLLLNFDGTNGSTTFTDDSGWGHAVTANGNAEISTTQSKFGGSSVALLSRSDTASLSPSSTFAFGTGDFTVECWFYSTQDETFGGTLFGQTEVGVNYFSFRAGTGDPVQRRLSFRYDTNTEFTHHATYSLNQWHHAAVVRSSGTVHLYLDGVQSTSSASVPFDFTNLTYNPTIGSHSHSTAAAKFFGYIDSLRITKGQALYTAAYLHTYG